MPASSPKDRSARLFLRSANVVLLITAAIALLMWTPPAYLALHLGMLLLVSACWYHVLHGRP